MGPVVTINSATLVNKGLEVIEAHLLFGIPFDRIEVVVHPTSVVHSMVEFVDGSTLVQASPPTMLIPIALGLDWPDRVPDAAPPVDWTRPETWEFFPLDDEAFPAVALARAAGERGGTAPAVYNAANEVCVEEFLAGRLRFADIVPTVASVVRGSTTYPRRRSSPSTTSSRPTRGPARRAHEHHRRGPHDRRCTTRSGVVIFVVAILASIGLHELGHMIPAKKFGGKVTQYFIGFGPTVWSKQRGETEYGVKAIPLGGYVKIVGMLPPGAEELDEDREHPVYDEDGNRVVRVRKSNTGMFTQLISDARAAEWEHDQARGLRPALLQDGVVEEGHRDGRRADGEHPDRVLHLPRRLRDATATAPASPSPAAGRRRGLRLRGAAPTENGRACTPERPGRARPRRPASQPGDTIVVVQRHRGRPAGRQLQDDDPRATTTARP